MKRFKINELSKVLGITSQTLRRYENNGYITPVRDESDYRWYSHNDIIRMLQIRLLRKCGFPHSYIEGFINNTMDDIRDISVKRLDEIDNEMRRLKYLRHWLKDNIQLIDTVREIGSGFMFMQCPALRYVVYGNGEALFTEKERLKTINDFLYTIEEVQLVNIHRLEDSEKRSSLTYNALVVKEIDIERLGIEEIIKNDKYIETYPSMECVYNVLTFPSECLEDEELLKKELIPYTERRDAYFEENKLRVSGDTMYFLLSVLGSSTHYLVCTPIERMEKENNL